MKPRILIPLPTSTDHDYNTRSIASYANSVREAGGDPIELPLSLPPNEVLALARTAHGILLPGSGADVDPARFGQPRQPECADPDPTRESIDNLLIEHAERTRTPLLCVCFGTQSLNVYRGGTLIQHLAPIPVNHRAGSAVSIAHAINVAPQSHLGRLITSAHNSAAKTSGTASQTTASAAANNPGAPYLAASSPDVGSSATATPAANTASSNSGDENRDELTTRNGLLHLNVNSSHHQAIGIPGEGLKIVARSSEDGVIEAIENDPTYRSKTQSNTPDTTAGNTPTESAAYKTTTASSPTEPGAPYLAASSPDVGSSATAPPTADNPHWLLALQWHPERTTNISPTSRAIFHDFIHAAEQSKAAQQSKPATGLSS